MIKTVDPETVPPPVEPEPNFASPCPEPAGGWRAPDPARATQETQEKALRRAANLPGYADAWIDDRGDAAQDPAKIVLNVSFTEELEAAERQLREIWGGPLCVSQAERTHAELSRIQRELDREPRTLSTSYGFGHIDLMVIFDDGRLKRRLDQTYDPGVVRVSSALQPYAG